MMEESELRNGGSPLPKPESSNASRRNDLTGAVKCVFGPTLEPRTNGGLRPPPEPPPPPMEVDRDGPGLSLAVEKASLNLEDGVTKWSVV